MKPGRSCPSHYYYGASSISNLPRKEVATLYVVGGLYGNNFALQAIESLFLDEKEDAVIAFNGDFNWFNIDAKSYVEINDFVLAHDASLGNVEIELFAKDNTLGCGCAYPEHVSDEVVERSNQIHRTLKRRAKTHPYILQQLSRLPMVRCYQIGTSQVAVVHGDSSSLAGWNFDANALKEPTQQSWLREQFEEANVDIFASTHTCLPALKRFKQVSKDYCIINNGSAGMPNFYNTHYGVLTRISTLPSPHLSLYGCQINDVFVDAIAVYYNPTNWLKYFQSNWPEDSAASLSYLNRICFGPNYLLKNVYLE